MNIIHAEMNTQDKLVNGKMNGAYDATHIWIPNDEKSKGGLDKPFAQRQFSVTHGSTLTIHDCTYTVQVKAKGCCQTQDKVILRNIE